MKQILALGIFLSALVIMPVSPQNFEKILIPVGNSLFINPFEDVHFNRCEGIFMGIGVETEEFPSQIFSGKKNSFYGKIGYGFSNKRVSYDMGFRFSLKNFSGKIGLHNFIDTNDRELISKQEETRRSFLLGRIYSDYFLRKGVSIAIGQRLGKNHLFGIEWERDEYLSVKTTTRWSLFGDEEKIRENLPIDDGRIRSMKISYVYDTRNHDKMPDMGWLSEVSAEWAGDPFNSDYKFWRCIIHIRKYLRPGHRHFLNIRLKAGIGKDMPLQRQFWLGGIGTLRGYRFKEFKGDKGMILGNIEYRYWLPFKILGRDLQVAVFIDAGSVWDRYNHFNVSDLRPSFGFGLQIGTLRINIARRADVKGADFVLIIRSRMMF